MEPNSQIPENIEESSSINPSKSPKKTQEQEESKEVKESTEKAQKISGENNEEQQDNFKIDKTLDKNEKDNSNVSENPLNLPKLMENPDAMIIEENSKPAATKSREILYGEDASEETKKQIESLFETAQTHASKEEYQQAINLYNKIVQLNEKSTAALIAMGHCFAMLEDNYRALQSYKQALNITPESQKDDQLWYGIGLLYQKIEDWKNAETSFRNALKLNPIPTLKGEILYHLGVIMKVRGDYQEGIKMLTNSILLGSFSVERMIDILCHIGTGLEELNELNEALQTYKYALMLDENNYRALQCLGWIYFQLEKTNEALEQLSKVGLMNDDDNNTNYMKARCYLKLSQHNKAYDCLQKCITKDPSNSQYWNSLGILFAELTQLKSSHECFSNALKFNPKSPENFFNMGCLFELCAQWNDAILMYDKALELHPNFQLAQNRKQGVQNQMESRNQTSLEVQFKHHKFILSFMKDIDKEKTLFFAPNKAIGGIFQTGSKSTTEQKGVDGNQEMQIEQPAEPSTASIPAFQMSFPSFPGNILSGLSSAQGGSKLIGTPSTTPKSNQNEMGNAFTPKQLISNPSSLLSTINQMQKPLLSNLSMQTVKPNTTNPNPLGGLSLFSTQKTISQSSLNNPSNEMGKLGESKGADEEKSSRSILSGFKSTTSPSEGFTEKNSFKINKSHASSLIPKSEGSVDEKSQEKTQKTGFKLTQKGNRGEEGLIPKKKVKLEIKNDQDEFEVVGVEKEPNQKTPSSILRPSTITK